MMKKKVPTCTYVKTVLPILQNYTFERNKKKIKKSCNGRETDASFIMHGKSAFVL